MSIEILANIIGLLGTGMVVSTYIMLQMRILQSESLQFNLMNLIGALFLLVSLTINFNMASFIIEIFWIGASLIGLYKWHKNRTP
jgi:hypothetical protein